jgi:hypothetical protein
MYPRSFSSGGAMPTRLPFLSAALVATAFVATEASAQTIRSYNQQAESQYGGTTATSTGEGTVRQSFVPGQPVPPPPQANSTSPNNAKDDSGKKGDGEKEEDTTNYITVFAGGSGSQKPVEELNLSETEMYRGVIPGKRDSVSHLSQDDSGDNRITWIGFQAKEDSSRVFFQTVRPADYEILSGDTSNILVVRFSDTKIPVRNFKRFIDTSAFEWNVRRIDAKQAGRNAVEVTIELASDEEPIISRNGGYLYLDFKKKVASDASNS